VASQAVLRGPDYLNVTMQYVHRPTVASQIYHFGLVLYTKERTSEQVLYGPNPKVRQWGQPRKSHDSDMLLSVTNRSSSQRAGGATKRAGAKISHRCVR